MVVIQSLGFPGGSDGKSGCLQCGRTQVQSLGQEDPLEKAMAPHSCLENPMDEGAWWAAVHGVAKSQTRLSDFTFTLFRFLFSH